MFIGGQWVSRSRECLPFTGCVQEAGTLGRFRWELHLAIWDAAPLSPVTPLPASVKSEIQA